MSDPLDIEELWKQTRAILRRWRLPKADSSPKLSTIPWQQLMGQRLFQDHAGRHD